MAVTNNQAQNRVVIVGGGIVGSAIASQLGGIKDFKITVIESSLNELKGSTGAAPGFVGRLNDDITLTKLAKESVSEYQQIPNGFDTVGGLEIATTPSGIKTLEHRCQLAKERGILAVPISSADAAKLAPHLHQVDTESHALHFPECGTANPTEITSWYRDQARAVGVEFIEAKALDIETKDGQVTGVNTSVGLLEINCLIVATGIWSTNLLKKIGVNLPIVPVAHPYVHTAPRDMRPKPSPFVRWPERYVYARDHGSFDGFGSYDHTPIPVDNLTASAIGSWEPDFDGAVERAAALFPTLIERDAMKPFNGIFAVTPDHLPLAGSINQIKGLWVASAVWITHAGGISKLLANMVAGNDVDVSMKIALDPNRFIGQDEAELRTKALNNYNDIWNNPEKKK